MPNARIGSEASLPVADLIRRVDWSASPLGEPGGWTVSLRSIFDMLVSAEAQIVLFWGADYVALYNDAYAPTIGDKHPRALGRPARENWAELWDDLEPLLQGVRETGRTFSAKDRPFYIERHGFGETVFFDISYSAVRDDDGEIGGVLCIVSETTERLQAERLLRESEAALRTSEEHARRQAEQLATLNHVAAAVAGEHELSRLVQIVTDAGVELSGAGFGAFFYNVLDTAGERYTLYALSGVPRETFDGFPMPRNTALFAPTFDGTGVVRSDDVTAEPLYGRNSPRAGMPDGHLPVRSYLAVPVIARDGEVLGGLFFGHAETSRFAAHHEALLVSLAAQAAIAIENARLIQRVREANETLERRVAERGAELEQAHEALRQAQKMEAIGQLTGGVAHDFNNLLTPIVGNLDLLRRKLGADPVLSRLIDSAGQSAERASTLVQRLLAFARRQPLQPSAVDLRALVDGMVGLLGSTLGPRIHVTVDVAEDLPFALADPNQIEMALLNLSVNARDAMPDGGTLAITIAAAEARAERPVVPPGRYVRLCVTDSGAGMDAATLARAVEPFFSTKGIGHGTGLGLSMVHGLASQLGGALHLESTPGVGTTAELWLPVSDAAPRPGECGGPRPVRGSGRILLVDDEPAVRATVAGMLDDLGYEVIEAASGAAALALLDEGLRPDLLLSDHLMPQMTGTDLARHFRERLPAGRILIMSGYADHNALAPEFPHLNKPFRQTDLSRALAPLLAVVATDG